MWLSTVHSSMATDARRHCSQGDVASNAFLLGLEDEVASPVTNGGWKPETVDKQMQVSEQSMKLLYAYLSKCRRILFKANGG